MASDQVLMLARRVMSLQHQAKGVDQSSLAWESLPVTVSVPLDG